MKYRNIQRGELIPVDCEYRRDNGEWVNYYDSVYRPRAKLLIISLLFWAFGAIGLLVYLTWGKW